MASALTVQRTAQDSTALTRGIFKRVSVPPLEMKTDKGGMAGTGFWHAAKAKKYLLDFIITVNDKKIDLVIS